MKGSLVICGMDRWAVQVHLCRGFIWVRRKVFMNGMRPKFLENSIVKRGYYEQPSPYVNAPSCHVNLLELSRYAKKCGKKLAELTREEVKKISI